MAKDGREKPAGQKLPGANKIFIAALSSAEKVVSVFFFTFLIF